MRTVTKDELADILKKHALWLIGDVMGVRANLCETNLRGANLYRANLCEANLHGANLCGANLCEANLCEANLCEANLCEADLCGANLYRANLYRAENLNFPIACPEKGSFIAFKKASDYIVELEIPEDALRSSATTRKCRCSKAKVISISNLDGTASDIESVRSGYDSNFFYTIGETVEVDNFDKDRWHECAPGIHFFITRQEAVDYNW